jgi:diguanylate cyclase (GGDEF)-like protein
MRTKLSLRLSLYWLVLVTLLPIFALLVYVTWVNHALQKERIYSGTSQLARTLSARLDQEFAAIESGLKILATSEYLDSGDLRSFHAQALAAVKSQIVYNFILTDAQGRQLVNTLRPYGSALPDTGTPAALQAVFTNVHTVLTDLFYGPVVHKPAIAMGVPIRVGDEIRYSLNVGLDPAALNRLLAQEPVPPGWLSVILDSSQTIVARSQSIDQFLGQKAVPAVTNAIAQKDEATIETLTLEGIPVVSSHFRSPQWRWTVAVGVPQSVLEASLREQLLRIFGGTVIALGIGLGLVFILSNRVLNMLGQLNEAAMGLGQDKAMALPNVVFKEIEAVRDALLLASKAMAQIKEQAHHDALTGLANRILFMEIALKQLATARRERSGMAILAIDLDNFKPVNDQLGHSTGDAVLKEVAKRMNANIRASDLAARQGGDEFFVLMHGADPDLATEFAKRLIDALSQPYPGVPIHVSASLGIATYPACGESIEDLMLHADLALYDAKHRGKSCLVMYSEMANSK